MSQCRTNLSRPFESLERRVLLAGDVSVFVDGDGDLHIVGDNAGNAILLDQFGDFTVRGANGTAINGVVDAVASFELSAGADILFDLRGGDDTLHVGTLSDSVNAPDDLVILSGSGDDQVILNGDVNVGDDLFISTGAGEDVVDVLTTTTGIVGDLTIQTGAGRDHIRLRSNVGGNTSVDTGPGDDVFEILT